MVAPPPIKRNSSGLRLESIDKFSSIPLVEYGIKSGMTFYNRVKKTSRLMNWILETSENVAANVIESMRPAFKIIEGPLEKIDKLGLMVLERVEEKLPKSIYLPPEMIYWNTKEYVADHVMKPVLKRADSFGDVIDGAIDKADHALDKYLPDKESSDNGANIEPEELKQNNHAVLTYRRSQRLSKKLKHKLKTRTVANVKALKNDVHILLYAAELIATNPKEAYRRYIELWSYLSQNEPENQKRPETMEQLFVLLVRESARKVVHLVNFTGTHASKIPKKIRHSANEFFHYVLYFSDHLFKMMKIDRANAVVSKISSTYDEVQMQTSSALERLAIFFSGRLEAEKIQMPNQSRVYSAFNGLY